MSRPLDDEWKPDAEHINALPEPVRQYIHDLETRADPAGDVRALVLTTDRCRQLEAALVEVPAWRVAPAAALALVDDQEVTAWGPPGLPQAVGPDDMIPDGYRPTMVYLWDVDVVELLYSIRLGLEAGVHIRRAVLDHAEQQAVELVRRLRLDPGLTAADADALKLALLHGRRL